MTKTIFGSTFRQTWPRVYLRCAGVIFLTTGAAKLISGFGASGIHRVPDPIFGIGFGKLMVAVGLVECLLAVMCRFVQSIYMPAVVTAFSSYLVFYRLGLWWIGWQAPCKCLGELTDILQVPARVADVLLWLILIFLVAGGALCLPSNWHHEEKAASPAEA